MKRRIVLTILSYLAVSTSVFAEVAVIVHPSNANTISEDDLKGLFLGKRKSFGDGNDAQALNLTAGDAAREEFNTRVLGKNDSQLKAYWSQLLFTGKGVPPKELDSAALVAEVSKNVNAIGYVDASKVDGSVKVILKF